MLIKKFKLHNQSRFHHTMVLAIQVVFPETLKRECHTNYVHHVAA